MHPGEVLRDDLDERGLWTNALSKALGESLPMIGLLLGHTQVETTARYAHLAEDSVKESAARVAESIAGDLLAGYPGSGIAASGQAGL